MLQKPVYSTGLVDKLCQKLNKNTRMWVDSNSPNENLSAKKKKVKSGGILDKLHDY